LTVCSQAIKTLAEAGVSLDEHGPHNTTALTTAVRDNRKDIVEFLLQAGADPNLIGDHYPLEHAVHRPQFISVLLAAGADLNRCKAIVRDAVWHNKLESVRLLVQAGAPINEAHKHGTTALTIAIEYNYSEIFDFLIQAGADPNQKGDHFPIDWAVHQPQFIKPLLAAGADIRNVKGLVRNAVWHRKAASIPLLLEAGAPINECHPHGTTALTTAVEYNHQDCFDILIAAGADPNQKGDILPLEWAVIHPQYIKPLLSAGADMSLCKGIVQLAVWHNKIEAVRILHGTGKADLNELHRNSNTPLITAIEYNYVDILRELLTLGADPNRDANGVFPLFKAAERETSDQVLMLLEAGANVNQARENGTTALMQAAYYGRTETVKKLIEKGADLEMADQSGNTAMDSAANQGHDEIVMLMLEGME
jgi:ankyrin repeat protein